MTTTWVSATVINNEKLTDRHFALTVKADLMPFEAGQFARFRVEVVNDEGELEAFAKPYSFINTPDEESVEIYFDIVPNGKVSNGLAALRAGDSVDISQPCVGFFVLSQIPDARDLWMMATGTGIGPYLSILKTEKVWDRFENIILVHAVPYANELTYSKTICHFSEHYPSTFQFIPVVSREGHQGALKGRIQDLIESGAFEEKAGVVISKKDSHVMLCGNSGMLKGSKAVLKERGLERHLNHKPGHVSSETYF